MCRVMGRDIRGLEEASVKGMGATRGLKDQARSLARVRYETFGEAGR